MSILRPQDPLQGTPKGRKDRQGTMKGARVKVSVGYPSQKEARVAFGAIYPEVGSGPSDRSQMEISREGSDLMITVEAEDAPALRASVNTAWRWLKLTGELIEV